MIEFEDADLSEEVVTRISEYLAKGEINSLDVTEEEGLILTSYIAVSSKEDPDRFALDVSNQVQLDFKLSESEGNKIYDLLLTRLKEK